MVFSRAKRIGMRVKKMYGSSGGGQSTLELLLSGEQATLDFHLAYAYLQDTFPQLVKEKDSEVDFYDTMWKLLEEVVFNVQANDHRVKRRLRSKAGVYISHITGSSRHPKDYWFERLYDGSLEEGLTAEPVLVDNIDTVAKARSAFYITGDWHFNSTYENMDAGDGDLSIMARNLTAEQLLPDKARKVVVLELCYKVPGWCETGKDPVMLGRVSMKEVVSMYEQGQDYASELLNTGTTKVGFARLAEKSHSGNSKLSEQRAMTEA